MALQLRLVRVDNHTQLQLGDGEGTTIILVVDRDRYELDFSAMSLKAFRDALEPFLRNATSSRIPPALFREIVALSSEPAHTGPKSGSRGREAMRERRDIREWWIQHWEEYGLPEPGPSGRGRIPAEVIAAYYGRRNGATRSGGDEGISGETSD